MSNRSAIEWTVTTWSKTTGCDQMSSGCNNCYALSLAKRLKAMGQAKYQNDGDPRTSGPHFGLTLHPDVSKEPYRCKSPRLVFVKSMFRRGLRLSVPSAAVSQTAWVSAASPASSAFVSLGALCHSPPANPVSREAACAVSASVTTRFVTAATFAHCYRILE